MKRHAWCLVLVALLALGANAGADFNKLIWNSEMPLVKGRAPTLTLATIKGATNADWKDIWFWKWAAKTMNVDFQVIQIDQLARSEKLNLMFASDDLPDALYNMNLTGVEVTRYGAMEEQLIRLNELIDRYGPNIQLFFKEEPRSRANAVYPNGSIYQLPGYIGYQPTEVYTTLRAWINEEWLKNLGLRNPESLEEFHDVLAAFKNRDPNRNGAADEIPFSERIAQVNQVFFNMLGVVTRDTSSLLPAMKDGKPLILANGGELYRAFLTQMNRFYTEGLIDRNAYTLTYAQLQANCVRDLVGVHVEAAPHVMTTTTWNQWTALKPMSSTWNGKKVWPESNDHIHGQYAIAHSSKQREVAMKFADWHFTQLASIYTWEGPPADSKDTMGIIGGWFYNEKLGDYDYNYPPGAKLAIEYITKFASPGTHTHVGVGASVPAKAILTGKPPKPLTGAPGWWRAKMDELNRPYYTMCYPPVYFGVKTTERISELVTPLQDYITTMEAKFVTGAEPLTGFDAYARRLKALGIDELEKYYVEAYAAYVKNLD